MQSSSLMSSLLVVLGSSTLASAVCSSYEVAIGTGATDSTGALTKYNVYTASSCATSQSGLSVPADYPCDSEYFLCQFGTTTFLEYDDPTSGISYLCAKDPAGETCGSDTITLCCNKGYGPDN